MNKHLRNLLMSILGISIAISSGCQQKPQGQSSQSSENIRHEESPDRPKETARSSDSAAHAADEMATTPVVQRFFDPVSFAKDELVQKIIYALFGYSDATEAVALITGHTDADFERLRNDLRTIRWGVTPQNKPRREYNLVWEQVEIDISTPPIQQFVQSIREIVQKDKDIESRKQYLRLLALMDSVFASVLLSSDYLVAHSTATPTRIPARHRHFIPSSGAIQSTALFRLALQEFLDKEFGPDAEEYLLTQEQRDYLMSVARAGEVKRLELVP